MTKEQAVRWAHMQIRANRLMDMKAGIVERCGVVPKEIHVYKGAATLANALEVPYTVKNVEGQYPIRIMFEFEGHTFFQMESELKDATDICDS